MGEKCAQIGVLVTLRPGGLGRGMGLDRELHQQLLWSRVDLRMTMTCDRNQTKHVLMARTSWMTSFLWKRAERAGSVCSSQKCQDRFQLVSAWMAPHRPRRCLLSVQGGAYLLAPFSSVACGVHPLHKGRIGSINALLRNVLKWHGADQFACKYRAGWVLCPN